MNDLLIIISGNSKRLTDLLDSSNPEVIKIDEKQLSDFKFIRSLTNKRENKSINFGCLNLEFQRFSFFINLFIFLSKAGCGSIIDESGNKVVFSKFNFVLLMIPKFILELAASSLVVSYNYLKLPVLRWILTKQK